MKLYKLSPDYNRVYNELKRIGVDAYACLLYTSDAADEGMAV